MIVEASAPGRCGIIGNPSDIYGGVVVSCSVPCRAHCRLVPSDTGELLPDPTLWVAATKRFPLDGYRVEWSSDVPPSSGLAGSTALLAATLACVLHARGEAPDLSSSEGKSAFAELVRDVELNDAEVQCGFQDAYMAVFGGLQKMTFDGKSPREVGPYAEMTNLPAELPFLLITTGVKRLSGSVHGPVIERWLARDNEILNAVSRIAELGKAGAQALLSSNWQMLADAMNENQRLIANWGGSGEAIDQLVKDCLESGALGAKLAGAGMGGTVIALAKNPSELRDRLAARGYTGFLRPSIEPGLEVQTR